MHTIIAAQPLPGYRLSLQFDDGVEGVVNLSDLVGAGVFEDWRDEAKFRAVAVDPESGTVCWPGGIDLCPDTLHSDITQNTTRTVGHTTVESLRQQ